MPGRRRVDAGAQLASGGSRPAAPTALRLWPRIASVILVLVVGLGATVAVAESSRRDADQREQLLAQQTANLAAATIQQLVAAISGVSGLPDATGVVDRQAFAAYALAAVDASPFQTLAYAPVVTDAARPAFEAAVGRPISAEPAGPPAPPRATYLPIRWVLPASERTRPLIGFDLATDDARRAAVEQSRDTGTAVISRTVASQPSGRPAVFVAHPVYRAGTPMEASVAERRAAVVGYVTTGVVGSALLDSIVDRVGDSVGIRIEDEDASGAGVGDVGPLVTSSPGPDGGVTVVREVGGRAWRITVDDLQSESRAAPWWLLAATLALAGTLAVFAWRAGRHQRQVGRHLVIVDGLADLGRALAGAGSVDAVARVVRTALPPALHASRAGLTVGGVAAGEDEDRANGPEPVGAGRSPVTAPAGGAGPLRPSGAATDGELDEAGRVGPMVIRRRVPDASGAVAGTLEVVWSDPDEVDDLTVAGLATAAEMCGQAVGRARVIDLARHDAVTSRLLASLAESAATAATADDVARRLVARAGEIPGATSTHIGLLTDDGHALRVTHQGLGPEGAEVEVRSVDHPWPLVEAFRRNVAVLLGDIDAVRAHFPAAAERMAAAGLASVAALPLVDDDGRPFGAVALTWASPQRFDSSLVSTLQTTADLCASSLGRATATDRAHAGTSALATLATHLSAARSFDEVGSAIVVHATRALSADFAMLGVVEGDHLRLLAPEGPTLGPLAPYLETELSGDFPALVALHERRLVTFPTLDDIAAADRRVALDLGALGLRAAACAPLMGADGDPTGALIVLWVRPPRFDDVLSARLRTVADLCAQSVERSRLFDAEHRVREDLQRTVLPPPANIDGLAVATRYQPAAAEMGMGGDWYDTIALDERRMCLVVGDVSGHGAGAVATMTQLRTVVHTLVVGGMTLPDVLARTSATMQRDGLGYATLLLAVVDLAAGAVDYVTAGHPPALVRQPGGAVHALTGGRHSVLGIDLTAKPVGYVPFPPGATLVLYTDGLIERRDTEIATSVDELVVRVRAAGTLDVDALADRLLAARPPGGSDLDDVALVVARRVG